MSSLVNMVPQRAILAESGEEVDAEAVNVGTIIAVKAGETIPIDGIVIEGDCEVDEKTLTGESFPVAKQKESAVWAGTINLNGNFPFLFFLLLFFFFLYTNGALILFQDILVLKLQLWLKIVWWLKWQSL